MKTIDWSDYSYFSLETDPMLACPCCGQINIDPAFLSMIDEARGDAEVPFHINSGCRCVSRDRSLHMGEVAAGAYNATSSHIKGLALDIRAKSDEVRYRIVKSLLKCGFRRIGIAKTFIHVDDDPDKPQEVCWVYSSTTHYGGSINRFSLLKMLMLDGTAANQIVIKGNEIVVPTVAPPSRSGLALFL